MPFEYATNLTALLNVLKNSNTTTSAVDLSNGLGTRLDQDNIQNGDPELQAIRADRLPSVFVRISNKDETWAGVGNTGVTSTRVKKEANITYDIIGMYGKDSASDDHPALLNNVYALARNIESILAHNVSLSDTALWVQAASTDFYGPFNIQGGGWVKVVLIKAEAKYLYR